MNVQDFYNNEFNENNRLSGNDNRHKIELFRKRFLYETIIENIKPKKIIQIACGTGIHTHWLCEQYPNIEIYASDIIGSHIDQVKDYPNLHKQIWDCVKEVPKEYYSADLVLVEGAWYHLHQQDRITLLANIAKMNPKIAIIDWLSAWHDTTQRILQDKITPKDYKNPRDNNLFVFDTEDDLKLLLDIYHKIELFPVDMDLRFGFIDFNQVSETIFNKYIDKMNDTIQIYDSNNTFIMNATEHGCYIIHNPSTSKKYMGKVINDILTTDEIINELKKQGYDNAENMVFNTKDFISLIKSGSFNSYDGTGYYHDGYFETDDQVFYGKVSFEDAIEKYPYVIWYNK